MPRSWTEADFAFTNRKRWAALLAPALSEHMSSQFVTSYLKLSERPELAEWLWRAAPALLFSDDGRRVLWANPAGAALLGAVDAADLLGHGLPASHPIARQIARAKATLRG